MRVVFLTHYSGLYGANKSLINLIQGIKHKIEAIVLIPSPGTITDELDKINIPWKIAPIEDSVYISSLKTELKRPLRIIRRLTVLNKTVSFIKMLKPDVIYSNSSVLTCGVATALKLNIPHVWHIREYGKEDYNLSYDLGVIGFKYYLMKSQKVITISKSIDEYIKSIAPDCKTSQIYNGVIWGKEVSDSGRSIKNKDVLNFAVVGYINQNKGQGIAVDAFKKLTAIYKNIRLQIVGEGDSDFVEYLKNEVKNSGLSEFIHFTGYIREPEKLYNNIDILLMCSIKEAFGRVTIEAMSRGIPVLGTNTGGTTELIEHNKNGLLFERTTDGLVSAIEQILKNPDLYDAWSKNALNTSKNFTIENYSSNIYKELVSLK